MDDRTGQLYDSRLAALLDGVPDEHIRQVEVVTIDRGPFKGRQYERLADGRLGRRVFSEPRVPVAENVQITEENNPFRQAFKSSVPVNFQDVADITIKGKFNTTATTGPHVVLGTPDSTELGPAEETPA